MGIDEDKRGALLGAADYARRDYYLKMVAHDLDQEKYNVLLKVNRDDMGLTQEN